MFKGFFKFHSHNFFKIPSSLKIPSFLNELTLNILANPKDRNVDLDWRRCCPGTEERLKALFHANLFLISFTLSIRERIADYFTSAIIHRRRVLEHITVRFLTKRRSDEMRVSLSSRRERSILTAQPYTDVVLAAKRNKKPLREIPRLCENGIPRRGFSSQRLGYL